MSLSNSPVPPFFIRLPRQSISRLINRVNEALTQGPLAHSDLLNRLVEQPGVRESLFLASPSLYEEWHNHLKRHQPLPLPLTLALWRYIFRGHSRSTPYGLFAGVGLGQVTSQTGVSFGSAAWQSVTRPDASVLVALHNRLGQDAQIRRQLTYSLNNSLYEIGGEYRFSEQTGEGDQPHVDLSSVQITPELCKLTDALTRAGALSFDALLDLFAPEQRTEAAHYLHQLIDMQFLHSSLALPATGPPLATFFSQMLDHLSVIDPARAALLTAQHDLARLPLRVDTLDRTQRALEHLKHQGVAPTKKPTSLIHTNLYFTPDRLELSASVVTTINRQLAKLTRLRVPVRPPRLRAFAGRFFDRYQQQAVPLLVALDPEAGVGYSGDNNAHTLLNDLPFKADTSTNESISFLDPLRTALYARYQLSKEHNVVLVDQDLRNLPGLSTLAPSASSSCVLGELYGTELSPPVAGPDWCFLIKPASVVSASTLLGRFCHGSVALTRAVEELCQREQAQFPGERLAEIVHLPSAPARVGNIISRPVLRRYEIPYLTPPAVSTENTMLLADLLVVAPDEQTIVLIHGPTGERVRPRLSSAHDLQGGDEVYQFLGDVAQSDTLALQWTWGNFSELPFLPRVSYDNLILCRAQWFIRAEANVEDSATAISAIRRRYELPRYVLLVEKDNELLLDLDFWPTQQILLAELRKRGSVRVLEWLGQVRENWVQDGPDMYNSEVLILLDQPLPAAVPAPTWRQASATIDPVDGGNRTKLPGEDWLYVKIYGNEQVTDRFLMDDLLPFYERAAASGWSDGLFFVRYSDPKSHLRIRMRCTPATYSLLTDAWPAAVKPYVIAGLVERLQFDTYERELERYGPRLMDSCETIFCADSQLVLRWLASLPERPTDMDRYAVALASLDDLLTVFSIGLEEKVLLATHLQQTFWQEHGGTKQLKDGLNRQYRQWATQVTRVDPKLTWLFNERKRAMAMPIHVIQTYYGHSSIGLLSSGLLSSLLHMAVNRLFPFQIRRHELVVYHFMARRYATELALQKKQK